MEGERDTLKERIETNEKRADIGEQLQDLYYHGLALKDQIVNSDNESPISIWQEQMGLWRQGLFEYLRDNVSAGKAHAVDGVPSVPRIFISNMKSNTTRREKEVIVAHINERLRRLLELMGEY